MRSKKQILEDFESFGAESLTYLDDTAVAKLFLRGLQDTEVGQKIVQKDLWTEENLEMITTRATAIGGPAFTFAQFVVAADLLDRLGKLVEPEPEPEVVDERPRDKNGKLLSAAQIQWKEFREWAQAPGRSIAEIHARRHKDAAFNNFYLKSLQGEMNSHPVETANAAGAPTERIHANDHLREFAQKYQREPSPNLKPKSGYVTLAGELIPYQTFLEQVTAATNAGLI